MVTYAQVDGEYMQLVNPKYFKLSLTVDLPKGKINVLVANDKCLEAAKGDYPTL